MKLAWKRCSHLKALHLGEDLLNQEVHCVRTALEGYGQIPLHLARPAWRLMTETRLRTDAVDLPTHTATRC